MIDYLKSVFSSPLGLVLILLALLSIFLLYIELHVEDINSIKATEVGDAQYGDSRFMTNAEKQKHFLWVKWEPKKWRKGINLPTKAGVVIGMVKKVDGLYAIIDTDEVHFSLTGQSGYGKTTSFFYANYEYSMATGVSFLSTDTKGLNCASWYLIAKDSYGFNPINFDFRSPLQSAQYNFLHPINKYVDIYLKEENKMSVNAVRAIAAAEKHAKIAAKSIIYSGETKSFGQNQYFYDGAEALIGSVFLLISEFGNVGERHVLSAYKLVQDFIAPDGGAVDMNKVQSSKFKQLLDILPMDHPCRMLAGTSLSAPSQVMMNIVSTAMSKLIAFIDTELEQILCFDSDLDITDFATKKTAVFMNLPEEDPTKWFLVSMIMKQTWNELISLADEYEKKELPNVVRYFMDEFGTYPTIDGAAEAFSAIRSRRVSLIVSSQTLSQFKEKYGEEGAEVILGNCQDNMFMAPSSLSKDKETYSNMLGTRTVASGSISDSAKGLSGNRQKSIQMISQPLRFPAQLAKMKKGDITIMKSGLDHSENNIKYYKDCGISIKKLYNAPTSPPKEVKYCTFESLKATITKYREAIDEIDNAKLSVENKKKSFDVWNAYITEAEMMMKYDWDDVVNNALFNYAADSLNSSYRLDKTTKGHTMLFPVVKNNDDLKAAKDDAPSGINTASSHDSNASDRHGVIIRV